MKKFRITLPLVALVLAIAASAFTVRSAPNARLLDEDMYKFTGTTEEQLYDAGNWQAVSVNDPACNGAGLPCVISITGDLQTFLTQAENNGGVSDISQEAESFRP